VAVCAGLAAFLYRVADDWVTSKPVRLALASLVVVAPVLGLENTATITNTIWALAAVAPWALVSLRERPLDVAMRAMVAFLAAASTPLSAMFLPLTLGAAWLRRSRAAWIVSASFMLGLVVQGTVFVTAHDPPENFWGNSLATLAELIGLRVLVVFVLGVKWTASLWSAHPTPLLVGVVACTVAIFVVLFPGAGSRAQALAAVFIVHAPIAFVIPVWIRGTTFVTWFGATGAHHRYGVIPTMLLSSAAAVLLAPSGAGRSRPIARIGRPVFVAHVVVLTLVGFAVVIPRSVSPRWRASVDQRYQAECIGAPPDKLVALSISAVGAFKVTLPCGRLAP